MDRVNQVDPVADVLQLSYRWLASNPCFHDSYSDKHAKDAYHGLLVALRKYFDNPLLWLRAAEMCNILCNGCQCGPGVFQAPAAVLWPQPVLTSFDILGHSHEDGSTDNEFVPLYEFIQHRLTQADKDSQPSLQFSFYAILNAKRLLLQQTQHGVDVPRLMAKFPICEGLTVTDVESIYSSSLVTAAYTALCLRKFGTLGRHCKELLSLEYATTRQRSFVKCYSDVLSFLSGSQDFLAFQPLISETEGEDGSESTEDDMMTYLPYLNACRKVQEIVGYILHGKNLVVATLHLEEYLQSSAGSIPRPVYALYMFLVTRNVDSSRKRLNVLHRMLLQFSPKYHDAYYQSNVNGSSEALILPPRKSKAMNNLMREMKVAASASNSLTEDENRTEGLRIVKIRQGEGKSIRVPL